MSEIVKCKRSTKAQIKLFLERIVGAYRCLGELKTDERPDVTKLVWIFHRFNYVPPKFTYANIDNALLRGLTDDQVFENIGAIAAASNHVSQEMLSDLEAHIVKTEISEYGDVEVLEMRDAEGNLVEGEIYVAENGNMSYTEHPPVALDETVYRGEKWGSW